MIESIWLEWKRATDEFKQVALSVRERILTKSRNSPTAVNRISRIDTTVCVMLSLQVFALHLSFCVCCTRQNILKILKRYKKHAQD